jgi:hypothetical protein
VDYCGAAEAVGSSIKGWKSGKEVRSEWWWVTRRWLSITHAGGQVDRRHGVMVAMVETDQGGGERESRQGESSI